MNIGHTNYSQFSGFWDDPGELSNKNSLIISDQIITYSELQRLSKDTIDYIQEKSVKKNCRIILIFDRWDLALYPLLLACRTLGYSILILPPATHTEKIFNAIETIKPAAIFYATKRADFAVEFNQKYQNENEIISSRLTHINSDVLILKNGIDISFNEAYIILSSGTTGENKFISIPESALNHFISVTQQRFNINAEDKIMHAFETTFDLFYFNLYMGLNFGATLIVFDRNDIWRPFRVLQKYSTNIWFSVPSYANLAISLYNEEKITLPSLKYILFCGEPLNKNLIAKWKKYYPDVYYENLYGPAELTIACTHYHIKEQNPGESTIPIGHIYQGSKYLIKNENGTYSKKGRGELCVCGPQLMNGYLVNNDNLHLLKPFFINEGEEYYATGDMVEVLDYDNLLFIGRTDRQFKYYGHIISPEYLEMNLQKLDGVEEAVLIPPAKTDNNEYENDNLHLYWSKSRACIIDDMEIENSMKNYIIKIMPKMKSVITYNKLESLPKTKSGKIDIQSINVINKDRVITSPLEKNSYETSRQLLARALNIDISKVADSCKIYEIPEWDSLNHLNVVFELTDNLGYEVDPYTCLSLRQIQNTLDAQLSNTPEMEVSRGLHGVILDVTAISKLDKFNSKIYYRGFDLHELINKYSFIDILSLLINSRIPTNNEKKLYEMEIHKGIKGARNYKNNAVNYINIENIVSQLLLLNGNEFLENDDKALVTLHIIGFLIGLHIKNVPDSSDPLGKIVLDTFSDGNSSKESYSAIEKCMILLAEHGACASTTTLRCVASTDNSFIACLSTALLTFYGKKHGGALLDVCKLLKEDNDLFGNAWIDVINRSSDTNTIPGFGHRVYLKEDPRVTILKDIMYEIDGTDRLNNEFNKLVSNVTSNSTKKFFPNVDLATGFLFRALNIRYEQILMTFVIARIAGWTAHYCEQVRNNTLIRPDFKYDHSHDIGGKPISD